MKKAPVIKHQFFDGVGDPLIGGFLYTYEKGTTTPLATSSDSDGLAANTNPIILDQRGECSLYLLDNREYDVRLLDANGVEIYTGSFEDETSIDSPTQTVTAITNITIDGNIDVQRHIEVTSLTPITISAANFSDGQIFEALVHNVSGVVVTMDTANFMEATNRSNSMTVLEAAGSVSAINGRFDAEFNKIVTQ